ncbi:acetyl-CoA carboxylase, carboxyltransferase subunit beta [Embleya hyalina]|uniref:Multifunctional fusion protein n=1 Tax=Embleya hyalina TaxID=516124 RepID=A0A401YPQ3_9ACTN|nr:acetyl-CoA carboxylase, carboxyltransferase subunit beta [Embleya hyalina]GCD96578.1 acetyl-CoA carboxylase beta subunit [Embleya hyalina]
MIETHPGLTVDSRPDWVKCGRCAELVYGKRFTRDLRVCPDCGEHARLTARERLDQLLDPGSETALRADPAPHDPLGFVDSRPYPERLDRARAETGMDEAAVCARGTIHGLPVVVVAMDFRFLGGSLGCAVGARVTAAADESLRTGIPLLLITASGGARMQEGVLSLMQMARTAHALAELDEAGVPVLSLITDPTYGGVAASFATLADVILIEPGARMGFAGPRVIEQTIGERLPEGFQTAEFLLEHGMVDTIVARPALRATLRHFLAVGGARAGRMGLNGVVSGGAGSDGVGSNGAASNGAASHGSGAKGIGVNGAAGEGPDGNESGANGSGANGSGANGSTSYGSAPMGTAPNGGARNGSGPDGAAGNGFASHGFGPDGAAEDGFVRNGSGPDGSASNGAASNGSTPNGSAVHGSASKGAGRSGSVPSGVVSEGSSTRGTTPNGAVRDGVAPKGSVRNGSASGGSAGNGSAAHGRASYEPAVDEFAGESGEPWEAVRLARHPGRPTALDYARRLLEDFHELHGDRIGADCPAIVGGIGRLDGRPVMLIGHQKGGDNLAERQRRRFGMATPAGFRKAARLMRLAGKLGLPVITLVDTPGANPGPDAERDGQAVAIAENLRLMARLATPIVTVITGEGGSGGALALAVADRVLIGEHGVYSVISPEGCAAILWKDPSAAPAAAAALRMGPRDLLRLGVVDRIVPEPPGGAHTDPGRAATLLRAALIPVVDELLVLSRTRLLRERGERFRRFGAPEATHAEASHADASRVETVRVETVRAEGARADSARAHSARAEAAPGEVVRVETVRAEAVPVEVAPVEGSAR